MKKTLTRRALLMSALALVLCVSMLVGTTFAWFTDSVTSKNNIIKSGNLDVVLEYWDGSAFAEVTDQIALFDDEALWEPGYVQVAYLKVSNAGSLALKYQLNVNVHNETLGKNKAGEDLKLSDYLVFKALDIDAAQVGTYTRESAMAAAGDAMGLKAYNGDTKALEQTGDADYLALIIYMPTTVGNEANHDGVNIPQIELGTTLAATQFTYEDDSFDNQYDAGAYLATVNTAAELTAAIANGDGARLGNDVTLAEGENLEIADGATVTLDLNSNTYTANISKSDGHAIKNSGDLTVLGGEVVSGAANGGSALYNAAGATLTVDGTTVKGASQADDGWPSYGINNYGTITISNADIETTHGGVSVMGAGASAVINNSNITVNGFGGSSHMFYSDKEGVLTINGGTYAHKGNGDGTLFAGLKSVTINGGTFSVSNGAYFALSDGTNIVINDADFSNIKNVHAWGGTMTINGGTFGFDPTAYADPTTVTDNGDGTWTVG